MDRIDSTTGGAAADTEGRVDTIGPASPIVPYAGTASVVVVVDVDTADIADVIVADVVVADVAGSLGAAVPNGDNPVHARDLGPATGSCSVCVSPCCRTAAPGPALGRSASRPCYYDGGDPEEDGRHEVGLGVVGHLEAGHPGAVHLHDRSWAHTCPRPRPAAWGCEVRVRHSGHGSPRGRHRCPQVAEGAVAVLAHRASACRAPTPVAFRRRCDGGGALRSPRCDRLHSCPQC